MKQDLQDNGLRKALQGATPYHLPSNFTFRTMQKVEEAVSLKEKRQERWTLFAVIVASLCLLASTVIIISIYWGESFASTFAELIHDIRRLALSASPHWMFSTLFLILLAFDYGMRKAYYKRHRPSESS